MVYILIATLVFLSDLMLKKTVESRLKDDETRTYCGGKLHVRKVHNKGLMMGFMKNRPKIVKRITLVAGAVFVIKLLMAVLSKKNKIGKAGLAMIIGGALSNGFDRMHQDYVTDYINIDTKKVPFLKKIYFNLADFFIVLGGIFTLFSGD